MLPRPFQVPRFPRVLALLSLLGISCAEGRASFVVHHAPEFQRVPTTVSILGVYRDGRMSTEAWAAMRPILSPALGQKSCDAAFSDELRHTNPELYAGIDEGTQADGITDELLAKLAPSAAGETIIAISVHGKLQSRSEGSNDPRVPPGQKNPGVGAYSRFAPPPVAVRLERGFEMSVAIYSVKQHRSVARIGMKYSGSELTEALTRFADELRKVLPNSTCGGWALPSTSSEDLRGHEL